MKKTLLLLFLFSRFVLTFADNKTGWEISTSEKGGDYYGAVVANGRIGILPWREPFAVRDVFLNHVFDADGRNGVSRVLRGINPFQMQMYIDGRNVALNDVDDWTQTLSMRDAVHRTSFSYMKKAKVRYEVRALRNMPYAGLINVCVEALDDIVLDVRMPDSMSGLELQEILTLRLIEIPIIFVSAHGDIEMAVRTIHNGAVDFLPKPVAEEKLLCAIERAVDISHRKQQERLCMRARHEDWKTLTPREKQVAALLAQGMPNKTVADTLNMTTRTAQVHRASIYLKLNVHSAAEIRGVMHSLNLKVD